MNLADKAARGGGVTLAFQAVKFIVQDRVADPAGEAADTQRTSASSPWSSLSPALQI